MKSLELNSYDVAAMIRGHAQNLIDNINNTNLDPDVMVAHVRKMLTFAEHLAAVQRADKAPAPAPEAANGQHAAN